MDYVISDSELIDYLHNTLSTERRAKVDAALSGSPELQGRLQFLTYASGELSSSTQTFADALDTSFLTDSIMRKVARDRVQARAFSVAELFAGIRAAFKPVMAAALVLIVVLATYNVVSAGQSDTELTTTEAMLGLAPVTIAEAYEASF